MSGPDPYYRPQGELFEVVLCKKDVNPMKAAPGDFKRVPVVANDPSAAVSHEDVTKAVGEEYKILQAGKPMVPTDYEHHANLRANAIHEIDKTKI